MKPCPIGIRTFEKIIEGNYLYVDKSELIYNLTHNVEINYAFLSCPRRFVKSLLVSTLEAYFQGRKELFKGLAIEKLEKDWIEYPVLRFDMSGGKDVIQKAYTEHNQKIAILIDEYDAPLAD